MFLKKDKFSNNNNQSIVNKLTLFYTLASLVTLSIIGIMLFVALNNLIITAENQYMIDEAHVVASILEKNSNNFEALQQEFNGIPLSLKNSSYFYYIRLIKTDGVKQNIVLETKDTSKLLQTNIFPIVDSANWMHRFVNWKSDTGNPFLLMTAPVKFDEAGKITHYIQMAFDANYPTKLLRKYVNYIILFLILFLIPSLLLGRLIAHRGLTSLHQIVAEAKQINVSKLSKRFDTSHLPMELLPLSAAFNTMLSSIESGFERLNYCTNELAHELRAPLNNLIVGIEVILSKPRNIYDYQKVLESSLEELRRLTKLIDNILFLARAKSPDAIVQKTNLVLQHELSRLCEFYRPLADEKQIKLHQDIHGCVFADPILFQRAISNLLDNAIKYTHVQGNIFVKVEPQLNSGVIISVIDDGVGISKTTLPYLFEPFYQVKFSEISLNKGCWLGLSIVKSIMDLHQGSIAIESKEKVGTKAHLYFP